LSTRILEKSLIRQLVLKVHGVASPLNIYSLTAANACKLLEVLFILLLPGHEEVFDLASDIHLIFKLPLENLRLKRYLLMILVLLENILYELFVLLRDLADVVFHLHDFDWLVTPLKSFSVPLSAFLFLFALFL
jgi:hypothetical protein